MNILAQASTLIYNTFTMQDGFKVDNKLNKYCLDCGDTLSRLGSKRCKGCYSKWQSEHFMGRKLSEETKKKIGEANFKGGRIITGEGYVMLWRPKHPNSQASGYILEHRYEMSYHLGRPLTSNERVHHKNGNKQDNRKENLILFPSHSEHIKFEHENGKKFAHKEILP